VGTIYETTLALPSSVIILPVVYVEIKKIH